MEHCIWCYAGVEHVGGDMFVSVPKGDAIFMKVIKLELPKHPFDYNFCLNG